MGEKEKKTDMPHQQDRQEEVELTVKDEGAAVTADPASETAAPHQKEDEEAQYKEQYDKDRKALEDSYSRKGKLLEEFLKSSQAEDSRRSRREHARNIIYSVGDGLSAIAGLIATANYAPPMYDPKHSMSETSLKRQAQLREARDKEKERALNISMRMADNDRDRVTGLAGLESLYRRQEQQRAAERARKAREPFELKKAQNEAEAAGYRRDKARTQAQYEPQRLAKDSEVKDSTIARNRAAAANSYASSGKDTLHFLGRTYANKEDRDKAVYEAARAYNNSLGDGEEGVWISYDTKDRYKNIKSTVLRDADDLAGELEYLYSKRNKGKNEEQSKRKTNVKWK